MTDIHAIFESINQFFAFVAPISDAVWDFPTNLAWYAAIPVLGQLSLPVLLLVGVGIYFTWKTRFIQWMSLSKTLPIMLRDRKSSKIGLSSLSSFMLGLAMRAGPGNIVGVTGAIIVGGPGALFWMWVAAFFGMATAFIEAVLAQLFKEQKGIEYIGGLPFYGRRLLGNFRIVGIFLSLIYIIYAMLNVPIQTFNVFTAAGVFFDEMLATTHERQSGLYYVIGIILTISCAFIILGGIRRVARYVDILVPIKAIFFAAVSLFVVIINFPLIPYFFKEVFVGAFVPHAIFGGAIGTAIAQGVKRGLMSNEAGQGTITMAAAVAHNKHPCEQGLVQSLGVFIDTMFICTLTGFVVVMAHIWTGNTTGVEWESIKASKISVYLTSVQSLMPVFIASLIKMLMAICYGLFAFTTLLGMISFAEISANFISKSAKFIVFIRALGALFFVPFGVLTVLAGLELGNLWYVSDLSNIIMVYLNIPIILIGAPWVYKALKHYRQTNGAAFVSKEIGLETPCWTTQQASKES